MSELANAEIVNLFASPFISHRWPDSDELSKELRQRVLAHEREHPGRSQSKSNVGGWHSQTGQLEFCAAGKTLLRRATSPTGPCMNSAISPSARACCSSRPSPSWSGSAASSRA